MLGVPRRAAFLCTAVLLVLGSACAVDPGRTGAASGTQPTQTGASPASSSPATPPAPTPPADLPAFTPATPDAGAPPCAAEPFSYLTTLDPGGHVISAVALEPEEGTGAVGVVLAHQSNGGPCMWQEYARTLAGKGYRVIAPSLTPEPLGAITAAASSLNAAGARDIVLIGASMGGTFVIAAAPWLEPAPAGVIALSPPDRYRGVDAGAAIQRVTAPILLAVGDKDTSFASAVARLGEAAPRNTRTVVAKGTADHGVQLVEGQPIVTDAVAAFLTEHAPVT